MIDIVLLMCLFFPISITFLLLHCYVILFQMSRFTELVELVVVGFVAVGGSAADVAFADDFHDGHAVSKFDFEVVVGL